MNKNVNNLSFGIGKLFSNDNKSGFMNSIKSDGSGFSSCLSKLSQREEKNEVKKETISGNNIKSVKSDEKSLKSRAASDDNMDTDKINTVKDDKAVSTKKENPSDEVNSDDELNTADEAVVLAVSGMVNTAAESDKVLVDLAVNTDNTLTSVDGVEEVNQSSDDIGLVQYITENTDSILENAPEIQNGSINTDTIQNVSNGSVEIINQNTMLNDGIMNTKISSDLNLPKASADISLDNIDTNRTADNIKNAGMSISNFSDSDDLTDGINIDENIANDIVSVKVNDDNAGLKSENVNAEGIENTVNVSLINQKVTVKDSKTEVKVDETEEVLSEIKEDSAELSGNVKNIDNNLQNGEETDTSDTAGFTDTLENNMNGLENSALNSVSHTSAEANTEVKVVNLHNTAMRNVNAAAAVQNTIIQNTSSMIGRMESKTMELMLNPEELGKIVIKMQSTSEGLNVKIIADNLDINKGLEMRMFQIENTLKAQGVTLNNIEIEHSSVSENSMGFSQFQNSDYEFEGSMQQNSNRGSQEKYIEHTEYSYAEGEDIGLDSSSDNMWRMGNSNVEFLA